MWRAGSDLRAWLFTIMHNVYVNQLALVRRDAANVSIDADPGNPAWQLPVRANQIDRVELLELVAADGAALRRSARGAAAGRRGGAALRGDRRASCRFRSAPVMSRLSRARNNLRQLVAEPAIGAARGQMNAIARS